MLKSKRANKILKILFSGAGSFFIWYFSGPLIAEFGRNTFELYYQLIYGIPEVSSLDYWFSYLPMRGHVTYYCYNYGDIIGAAIAAPILYRIPDKLKTLFAKKNEPTISEHTARELIEINGKLNTLIDELDLKNSHINLQDLSSPLRMLIASSLGERNEETDKRVIDNKDKMENLNPVGVKSQVL